MNKRDIKKNRYKEQLEEAIIGVETTINQINRLANYESLGKDIITYDIESCYADLELELAILAILLRKMRENQYIKMDDKFRNSTNVIIHSNGFIYTDDKIVVKSRTKDIEVNIKYLLDKAKWAINTI